MNLLRHLLSIIIITITIIIIIIIIIYFYFVTGVIVFRLIMSHFVMNRIINNTVYILSNLSLAI